MYAIIVSGGKQHPVSPGQTVRLEKLPQSEGEQVEFGQVAMVTRDDGQVIVGTPWIEGGRVTGEIVAHGRGKKIQIIKMRRRKNYRRRQGHRQAYTDVRINEIVT